MSTATARRDEVVEKVTVADGLHVSHIQVSLYIEHLGYLTDVYLAEEPPSRPNSVPPTVEIQNDNGKGKEREHDTDATPSRAETPDGQDKDKKRVQPSRSSRRNVHALGLGTSAIDLMILDSQQRAGMSHSPRAILWKSNTVTARRSAANKPLLPPNAVFFLTTDSSLVPPLAEGSRSDFSRPAAFCSRKGDDIPTPEFWPLPASETVSTRLRARGGGDEVRFFVTWRVCLLASYIDVMTVLVW